MNQEIIKEDYNKENPVIIHNYPYGFKRTDKRIWIESKGEKQRIGEQTLNPVSKCWNKPHYSTYSDLFLLYRDLEDSNYIKSYSFDLTYSDQEDLKELLDLLGDFRTEKINKIIKVANAIYKTREFIKVEIKPQRFRHKVTGEIKERIDIFELNDYEEVKEENEEEKQKEIKKDINKLFYIHAKQEGLKDQEIKEAMGVKK